MIDIETSLSYPPFRDCVERLVRRKIEAERDRTAANYRSAWKKFVSFLGRKRAIGLVITDITPVMIQEFVMWLLQDEKSGNDLLSPGTQDFYLRNLKAMYNSIKKDLRYRREGNPFDGLRISVPPTRKRALPLRQLKRLVELDLSDNPNQYAALQLSLFLFYARGMCFVDAFKLEKDNVRGGYIQYTRSKTQVALQVKITPEMEEIMYRYKRNNSRWVFPFLHEKTIGVGEISEQSSLHRVNSFLKEIGEKLGLSYPLTTYVMRHSWASLMLESGSEIGIISQSLGHTSLQTTEIYLGQLSKSKMDRASDSMLNNLVRPESKRKRNTHRKSIAALLKEAAREPRKESRPAPVQKASFAGKCKSLLSILAAKLF
ncbi:tyrosine-type recombinase/integrase [Parabacteroides sp.]